MRRQPLEVLEQIDFEAHDTIPCAPMEEKAEGIRDTVYQQVMHSMQPLGELNFANDDDM